MTPLFFILILCIGVLIGLGLAALWITAEDILGSDLPPDVETRPRDMVCSGGTDVSNHRAVQRRGMCSRVHHKQR